MKNYGILCCIAVAVVFCLVKFLNSPKCIINANGTCITKIEKVKSSGGNYWEGAVKQCKGEKNLPTEQDLENIKSYIYDGDAEPVYLSGKISKADIKKALSHRPKVNQAHISEFGGFNKYYTFGLYVLSSKKMGDSVYFRDFGEGGTNDGYVNPTNGKLVSRFVAMCVKH